MSNGGRREYRKEKRSYNPMRCFDCGRREKLYEYGDGRRIINLCAMCKAEREWREKPEEALIKIVPPPPKTPWERFKEQVAEWFRVLLRRKN